MGGVDSITRVNGVFEAWEGDEHVVDTMIEVGQRAYIRDHSLRGSRMLG